MQEQIIKIINKYLHNAILDSLLDRDGALYIMVNVQSKVDDILSNTIKQELITELHIPIKLCFTENKSTKKRPTKAKHKITGVKKVIMICSGKGGVGKSTISSHLAYYLQSSGYRVGLFDSDIYGPSMQKIFNIDKELDIKNGKFIPHEKFGIKLMSMGFIVQSHDALVWRGPMVTKTLNQMLLQTDWNDGKYDLDYLIIDTPPGTGDVHLSLAENYEIDGAIIVSTPQSLAIANAHRSVDMLQKLNIKLIGVIENMAFLIEKDGSKNYIFGKNNVSKYAHNMNLKLLATIPVISEISTSNIFNVDEYLRYFDYFFF